ncbi:MAG: DUF1153 domain-containing protein [Alphaproteobacteria bacterium]|nr:DUF1153 domain-containing protein [Alphaproteobacteria bacterium]
MVDGNLHPANESSTAPVRRPDDGGVATAVSALPPPTTKRWVIRRKAAVVAAVRAGVLTLEEACQRYHLSVEEFLSWQRLIDRHGMRGLRATRLQDYRLQRPLQTG